MPEQIEGILLKETLGGLERLLSEAQHVHDKMPLGVRKNIYDHSDLEYELWSLVFPLSQLSNESRQVLVQLVKDVTELINNERLGSISEEDIKALVAIRKLLMKLPRRSKRNLNDYIVRMTEGEDGYLLLESKGGKFEARFRYNISQNSRDEFELG